MVVIYAKMSEERFRGVYTYQNITGMLPDLNFDLSMNLQGNGHFV